MLPPRVELSANRFLSLESQKTSVNALYNDALILALQAKLLRIKKVKILRLNYETQEHYEFEMDEEIIEKKYKEFIKVYTSLSSQETIDSIKSRTKRNIQLLMVDFAKEEKIKEILDENGHPVLLPASGKYASYYL
jgi:hypothetical protein